MDAKIGTFEVAADTLCACDPIYINDPHFRAQIDDCVPGTWEAYAILSDPKDYGVQRVWFLVALHEGCPLEREALLKAIRENRMPKGFRFITQDIWLDFGLCGFFARPQPGTGSRQSGNVWAWKNGLADLCKSLVPQEPPYGAVLPGGVVAACGKYRDSAPGFFHRNENGQADAAFLRFM